MHKGEEKEDQETNNLARFTWDPLNKRGDH